MSYCIKNNYHGVTENYGSICSKSEEKDIGIPTTETILIKKLINVYFEIMIQIKEVIKIKDTTKQNNILKDIMTFLNDTIESIKLNLVIISSYKDTNIIKILPIFSFSIPKYDNICEIVEFLKRKNCETVIEIGSGLGLWAALLKIVAINKKYDFKMIATDTLECYNEYEYVNYVDKIYIPIRERNDTDYLIPKLEKLEANEAIEKYKDSHCLFLCWPPNQSFVEKGQYDCGQILKKFQGTYLIYIGNPLQTGSTLFNKTLYKNWKESVKILPNMSKTDGEFSSLRYVLEDYIYFYERDEEKEKMNKKPAEIVRDDVLRKSDLKTPLLSEPDF
jgi:hypothetical protein